VSDFEIDPFLGEPQNPAQTPTPTPTPTPEKTQAQKQKDYEDCFNQEVEKLKQQFHPELERIMNRGLRNTIMGGVGGGGLTSIVTLSAGGIGISIGVLAALLQWRDAVLDFEREKLGPAREASKEKCRKQAGL